MRTNHHLVKHWLQIPDAYWTWAKTATRTANKIMEERIIQLVFTTAPPYLLPFGRGIVTQKRSQVGGRLS